MNDICLLDCTLRDGGYLVDKKFGENTIKGIIQGLQEAHIEFIEIGFLQNDGFGEGKTVYLNSQEAKKYVPKEKDGCLFTVLADCSRYDVSNLDDCDETSFDAVRECFFKSEIKQAIENCKRIKEKGYLVFVQPVDILGYTDKELLELIEYINQIEPYCFSIVDTFGSMYQEDLQRLIEIIDYNLIPKIKLGFHSHNNMYLSNALSQDFIRMTMGRRKAIVDATLSGMGRGAGNTPTELIAQYMVSKHQGGYNIDSLLDILDVYVENLRSRCSWGYSTEFFVAGSFASHVNNVSYLKAKNSLSSKDIRYILNGLDIQDRKRYDYEKLEKAYIDYLDSSFDDTENLEILKTVAKDRNVLLMAPGRTIKRNKAEIIDFIRDKQPLIIAINFIPEFCNLDFLYVSNKKRYQYLSQDASFFRVNKIITSNISDNSNSDIIRLNFIKLIKCGWEYSDSSVMMALRMLDLLSVKAIYIAGFDGYDMGQKNYYSENLELPPKDIHLVNKEIDEMFMDYLKNRINKDVAIEFVTPSRFERKES